MSASISGVKVNSYQFIGVTTIHNLRKEGLCRPSAKQKDLGKDRQAQDNLDLRKIVQRTFDAGRTRNAKAYANYIAGVESGQIDGGFPPINLYLDRAADVGPEGLTIRPHTSMCVIDGETQTEARFLLYEDLVDEASAHWPVKVVVWHNCDVSQARQYLVDTNLYCNPINSGTAMKMDSSGRLTRALRLVQTNLGLDESTVAISPALPTTSSTLTHQQLTAAAVGFILGTHLSKKPFSGHAEELNRFIPSKDCYAFDEEVLVKQVTALAEEVIRQGLNRTMVPRVWQACGIKMKSGVQPSQMNFARGIASVLKKGGNDAKIHAVVVAL